MSGTDTATPGSGALRSQLTHLESRTKKMAIKGTTRHKTQPKNAPQIIVSPSAVAPDSAPLPLRSAGQLP